MSGVRNGRGSRGWLCGAMFLTGAAAHAADTPPLLNASAATAHEAALATRHDATRTLHDPALATASADVREAVSWIAATRNAHGGPFAVVDKRGARLFVFAANGRLVGDTAALLGLARGDDSAPGVGRRAGTYIAPQDRTTPAGRFASEPGHNNKGEAIVWIDYTAAVAIHRLRPTDPAERRPQRLASSTPDDNRISLGCVVVDPAFYDAVVAPTLGRSRGVVYVLPETRDWRVAFGVKPGPHGPVPALATALAPSDLP